MSYKRWQAAHVGKVVVSMPPEASTGGENGTVFVTGGTGGLGCHVAAWLVTQKVRRNMT